MTRSVVVWLGMALYVATRATGVDICTPPLIFTPVGSDGTNPSVNCSSIGKRCSQPISATTPTVVKTNPSCDPVAGPCEVTITVQNVRFPGNRLNYPDAIGPSYARVELFGGGGGGPMSSCGALAPAQLTDDIGTVSFVFSPQCGTSTVDARVDLISCQGFTFPPSCEKTTPVDLGLRTALNCP